MIKYADSTNQSQIRWMWKTVFGDDEAYMDIYFRDKYRNSQTLAYFIGDTAVASLQMLPYNFTFCDKEIPVAYISGACTLPEHRGKGYMGRLLETAFSEMSKKDIPLSILVPQQPQLVKYYDKFGYSKTFDESETDLPSLKELVSFYPRNMQGAYEVFDSRFRDKDMTVQKTFEDFKTIVAEAKLYNYPPKKNLLGMARIIDAEKLVKIFAERYPEKAFSFYITDEIITSNNMGLMFHMGKVIKNPSHVNTFREVNIRTLTQLLIGYHTSEAEDTFRLLFPEKVPQMNFMLE